MPANSNLTVFNDSKLLAQSYFQDLGFLVDFPDHPRKLGYDIALTKGGSTLRYKIKSIKPKAGKYYFYKPGTYKSKIFGYKTIFVDPSAGKCGFNQEDFYNEAKR